VSDASAPETSWTTRAREMAVGALPPERLLPDAQPSYVASWIYVFGVASIASLMVIVGSGVILSLKGPACTPSGIRSNRSKPPPTPTSS
jgi:hypothetical protein